MNSDNARKSPASDDNSGCASISKESDQLKHEDVGAETNLNDFLELLKVSCHVNDMISNIDHQKGSSSTAGGLSGEVDFEKLAKNRLVNDLFERRKGGGVGGHDDVTDSASSSGATERSRSRRRSSLGAASLACYSRYNTKKSMDAAGSTGLHPKLNEQLDYVINEGVLDAVLPFICPVPVPPTFQGRSKTRKDPPQGKLPLTTAAIGNVINSGAEADNEAESRGMAKFKEVVKHGHRKSQLNAKPAEKKEPEVIIHVCDEVKNISRDFSCLQSLLVSKMGYFADVTAGQKLEDMDISVHCDVQIFDWLMKWVKCSLHTSGTATTLDDPQLDASNVVPILVSASFLQMEPLLIDCLSFCHARLSDVVRSSANLSCLNDSIVTRLAAMFTNLELEMVRDKRDRVTPRIWTKLIHSLCEPEPEALRGHYYSLSGLFRCFRCGKCLTNTMKSHISCLPANIRLNRWGQVVSHHVRDSSWDINAFITQLFKELKSWRRVYWKLWGHCHFLYCCICEMHFPVYQMTWCRFHPEGPNFLGPVTEGRISGPAGRYPCCGQQAFRFETLSGPNGCQFREHSVLVETDRDRAILSIAQLASEGYALCENPPTKLQALLSSGDVEPPRWLGMSLTPQHCRQGLLPVLNPEESSTRLMRHGVQQFNESSSDSDNSDNSVDAREGRRHLSHDFLSSSDGCESECGGRKMVYTKGGKKKRQTNIIAGRYWSGDISARSNQDHQRQFEEKVMKQVVVMVNKKTGSEHSLLQNVQPVGGSYVRLEAEWKDQLKQRNNSNTNYSNTNISLAKPKNK